MAKLFGAVTSKDQMPKTEALAMLEMPKVPLVTSTQLISTRRMMSWNGTAAR